VSTTGLELRDDSLRAGKKGVFFGGRGGGGAAVDPPAVMAYEEEGDEAGRLSES
jgi:hypothetical protein